MKNNQKIMILVITIILLISLNLFLITNADYIYSNAEGPGFVKSNVIKSMKLKKDGNFSSFAKVLNDDEINNLIKLTDKKINDAIGGICNGNFDINPKSAYGKNLGCQYCEYKDICYVKKHDEMEINPFSDLSFLGGDINA